MPYTVKDNVDLSLPGNASNVTKAINVLATQIKALTGKTSWKEAPQASIAEVVAIAGSQGEKGEQGDPGVDGKSAYQVWLDAGNTGDVSDFLLSLRGEKGDTGDDASADLSAIEVDIAALDTRVNALESQSQSPSTSRFFIQLLDKKDSGVNGGFAVVSQWSDRVINFVATDETGLIVLSNNTFTLPAGTYEIAAYFTFFAMADTKLRLYNNTDDSVILYGVNSYFQASPAGAALQMPIAGKFTIGSGKSLSIQYWAKPASNLNQYNFGGSVGDGSPEIYSIVNLWKVG